MESENYKMRGDLGKAWNSLLFDMYYRYRGYKGIRRPDGTLLILNSIMTIEEFHKWVDDIYESIDQSINRLKK